MSSDNFADIHDEDDDDDLEEKDKNETKSSSSEQLNLGEQLNGPKLISFDGDQVCKKKNES
jgi:hypothetical protein